MALTKPSYIKYAPSWLFYGLIWLLSQLPYALLIMIGQGLGAVIYHLIPSRVKVVTTNLRLCFPEIKSTQRQLMIKNNFKELGIMITQTFKTFLSNTKTLEQNATIEGGEHIENCLKENKGVLLVAGHFTALDMGGKILCKKYPIAGMYRPHKHPLVEYIVTRSRLRYATHMFKRDELRPIIKHLKNGGVLWYAPDQNYRRGQSVFVPFFERKAATITATHQLARLSKCAVLFFHVQRNSEKPHYTLTISPPLPDFPSKDAIEDTTRINKGIEDMVKINPSEYLWIHKRFKTVEKGEKNPY